MARTLGYVRILAVVGDELTGVDEGRDWAVLEALVAANGPASIEVRVLAIVNRRRNSILFGMPLGKAVGRMSTPGAGEGYDAGESARQRLDRALTYLRGLGTPMATSATVTLTTPRGINSQAAAMTACCSWCAMTARGSLDSPVAARRHACADHSRSR
jgi:hypothetical protein